VPALLSGCGGLLPQGGRKNQPRTRREQRTSACPRAGGATGALRSSKPRWCSTAMQPQVTATLDQQAFDEVKTSWAAGSSLSIGPFSFGGGAGGSHDHAEFNDQHRRISLTSGSLHRRSWPRSA
jgi:hypothetical protein